MRFGTRILGRLGRFTDQEQGQGMVEYGLILILIGIFLVAILVIMGGQVTNLYRNISGGFSG